MATPEQFGVFFGANGVDTTCLQSLNTEFKCEAYVRSPCSIVIEPPSDPSWQIQHVHHTNMNYSVHILVTYKG